MDANLQKNRTTQASKFHRICQKRPFRSMWITFSKNISLIFNVLFFFGQKSTQRFSRCYIYYIQGVRNKE